MTNLKLKATRFLNWSDATDRTHSLCDLLHGAVIIAFITCGIAAHKHDEGSFPNSSQPERKKRPERESSTMN